MEDVTVLVDYTIRKFCIQYVSKMWPSSFHNKSMLVLLFLFFRIRENCIKC